MIRVKICGITDIESALFAQENNADALGFIFTPKSKRFVDPKRVKKIISELNPFIAKIGVFVNSSQHEIEEIASFCNLTHVQLHGDESIEFAENLNRSVIKALSFDENLSSRILMWKKYPVLIDSGNSEMRGGTGHTIPWEKLKKITDNLKFILAGGLTPGNVKQAIDILNPYSVDVSSGVENAPGIKNHNMIKSFIETVKK